MMTRRLAGVAAAVPLLLVVVLLAANRGAALDYYVGGRDGWTAKPTEPYNRWAERNHFQVNDCLVFRYSKEDSVLMVSQSHYDACNVTDPFLRLDGGDSIFVPAYSGPFFFISGDAGRCQDGERLIVVVLAVCNNNTASSPTTTTPPPASSPPTVPAPTPHTPPPSPSFASALRGDALLLLLPLPPVIVGV